MTRDHAGKPQVSPGANEGGETVDKSLCCGLCGKERVKRGKLVYDWPVWMISAGSGT